VDARVAVAAGLGVAVGADVAGGLVDGTSVDVAAWVGGTGVAVGVGVATEQARLIRTTRARTTAGNFK